MHIAQAWELHQQQRSAREVSGGERRSEGRWSLGFFCLPCHLLYLDRSGSKFYPWCLLGLLIGTAVVCIGRFEATRLTTHLQRSPCTIVDNEVIDVGSCTLCDTSSPVNCEVHPIATGRLSVTYRPLHSQKNVTGWVWYCKGRAAVDPCASEVHFTDQMSLDVKEYGRLTSYDPWAAGSPVPCTAGEVFAYMQMRSQDPIGLQCYYSSRDYDAEDVWLSMPSPGLVDHAWFQKHFEYPVLLTLGGLVLLSVLLGCLALEGAELWASGLL